MPVKPSKLLSSHALKTLGHERCEVARPDACQDPHAHRESTGHDMVKSLASDPSRELLAVSFDSVEMMKSWYIRDTPCLDD